jgi:hypothetical protein
MRTAPDYVQEMDGKWCKSEIISGEKGYLLIVPLKYPCRVFFASPFCRKLQNKNAESCNCIFHKIATIITDRFSMFKKVSLWDFRSVLRLSRGFRRHNRAPTPLFHGPLDRLAFLRARIVPITGSQT